MKQKATRIVLALGAASLTHGLFAAAIVTMAIALYSGLAIGRGTLRGAPAVLANLALVLQFPAIHSLLLSKRGRGLLARLAPAPFAVDFAPTTFVGIASLQLLATFLLWSPSGVVLYRAEGSALLAFQIAYAASWCLLVRAIADAGLGVQTGSIGWLAVLRGRKPEYGAMPQRGLFRASRQPIYLAYALTLWTGPVRTLDGLLLAVFWTGYCYLGPLHKEKRYLGYFGERFAEYRSRVPYFFPRIPR